MDLFNKNNKQLSSVYIPKETTLKIPRKDWDFGTDGSSYYANVTLSKDIGFILYSIKENGTKEELLEDYPFLQPQQCSHADDCICLDYKQITPEIHEKVSIILESKHNLTREEADPEIRWCCSEDLMYIKCMHSSIGFLLGVYIGD